MKLASASPLIRRGAPLALLAAGALLFTGCTPTSQAAEGGLQNVTVGTGELSPVNDVIAEVAKEHGINVEWQSFSDWTLPNQALAHGESDVNAFQHLAFLSAYNVAENQDLTPIGSTQITTWGIYSDNYPSVDALPEGATIAIPNDPSNSARTLFLLQQAGLITLATDVGIYPTVDDITQNSKNLKFSPIVAQQLVNVYKDVDAIVVGTATIDQALSITKDKALAIDDPNAKSSLPYVNVVAVRGEDADSEVYRELAKSWKDPRVMEAIKEESKDNSIVVDIPVDQLRETLTELEDLARGLEK